MLLKRRFRVNSNPILSASSSETRQIRAKSQIAIRLCYSASRLSKNPANESTSEHESNSEAVPQRQTSVRRLGHQASPREATSELQSPARGAGTFLPCVLHGKDPSDAACGPLHRCTQAKARSEAKGTWTPVPQACNFHRNPNRRRMRNRTSLLA